MVVDSKHAETVGQIFVATSLLDPLELTAMGQGLELPEGIDIYSLNKLLTYSQLV